MQQIYLDHNSTTPIDPVVVDAMMDCFRSGYVNPASQHRMGQTARKQLEAHRVQILSRLGGVTAGMQADRLVFTSGGTESNNLALIGLARAAWQRRQSDDPTARPGTVLVSAIEHPSVVGAAEHLSRLGFNIVTIGADSRGQVQADRLAELLDNHADTDLVSVMLANNETGVIQPVARVAEMCRSKRVVCHTDAVQAVGKIPVSFRNLGVDALSLTAHKFGGPRGIGGLILHHGIEPEPILFGGFQQMGSRPGTEDLALVIGLATALNIYHEHPERMQRVANLRDALQARLENELSDAVVIGRDVPRVPPTLNIAFKGVDRQAALMACDLAGLAISTGSACASGSSEPSPVLIAMGLDREVVEGALRISLGVTNSPVEIEETARRIINVVNGLRQRK